jgi:Zn-dependent protease
VHDPYARQPLPRGSAPGWPPADVEAPPPPPPQAPPEPPAREQSAFRRAGAAIIGTILVIAKWGKGALLLLGKGKFFVSMFISIGAYALIWGWKFGAVFVGLLLIHEMGHVIQLRREGIKASAPLFIPFLGAYVGMKEMPKDAAAEARVGLAGPVLGTIGCAIPAAFWIATGDPFWQACTFVGLFLNLFNLVPVLPLDGGRAMQALSSWIWGVGFLLFVGVAVIYPSPIIILIVLFGGMETWRRWKHRDDPETQEYNRITPRQRIAIGLVYLGLVVVLGIGVELTHLQRTFSDA